MAFASPADLAQFLQTATEADATAGDPNVLDTAIAQQALDSATATIVAACGWPILTETTTVLTRACPTILLPTLRLTAVGSVVDQAGNTVTPALYSWEEWGELTLWGSWWSQRQIINTGIATSHTPWNRLAITFTHGYDTVPAAVKDVCLELAASRYNNPTNLASTSRLGAVDVFRRSTTDGGVDLDGDARLDAYRLASL